MYYPYFRGKQYELITVREAAAELARLRFVPIIEPVKESLGSLVRTLQAVCDARGRVVVIVNPYHGDHADTGDGISQLLRQQFHGCPEIVIGVLLKKGMSVGDVMNCCQGHPGAEKALVHDGFADGKELSQALGVQADQMLHVFLEPSCGKLYRKHFGGNQRVLIRDGFHRRRNRDHPELEFFSDLHITYGEEGMNGFGDFLIVGNEYTESGGPAYAVAIHLTFIDPSKDDAMFVYHFVSQRQDTPTDPAGKFYEALEALVQKVQEPGSNIFRSSAVLEFLSLHANRHFPGLGYAKKLSMRHHIETLGNFLP